MWNFWNFKSKVEGNQLQILQLQRNKQWENLQLLDSVQALLQRIKDVQVMQQQTGQQAVKCLRSSCNYVGICKEKD